LTLNYRQSGSSNQLPWKRDFRSFERVESKTSRNYGKSLRDLSQTS
jgi:hypothetical protein